MKTIGRTNDHQYLVEMTPSEYKALAFLSEAIEGKSIEFLRLDRENQQLFPDFSGVFGAIGAFALAKFRINEIRLMADELENAVTNLEIKER